MKCLRILFISILVFLLFSFSLLAYPIDRIRYMVKGSPGNLESLELKLINEIDNINSLGLNVIHDGENIKFEGDWQINFLKRSTYEINFEFLFPLEINGMNLGKGLGFSGENFYTGANRYYWKVAYFFDREDDLVYEGGLKFPISRDGLLILGAGNTYWNSNNTIHLGFEIGI